MKPRRAHAPWPPAPGIRPLLPGTLGVFPLADVGELPLFLTGPGVYRRDRVNLETAYYAQSTETMAYGPDLLDPHSDFISKHLQRVFVQIYRIVRNVADAQDLTQETFIKALQHRDQLKDEQKAAQWLSRIATNAAIDFVRRYTRASFTGIDDTRQIHDENPERILMRAQMRASIDAGLDLLTPRERAALLLRDVEGMPAEEVALLLDCSKATVRSHIAHARIKLRGYLTETSAEGPCPRLD